MLFHDNVEQNCRGVAMLAELFAAFSRRSGKQAFQMSPKIYLSGQGEAGGLSDILIVVDDENFPGRVRPDVVSTMKAGCFASELHVTVGFELHDVIASLRPFSGRQRSRIFAKHREEHMKLPHDGRFVSTSRETECQAEKKRPPKEIDENPLEPHFCAT